VAQPVFNRIDLAMMLQDGTQSEKIVIYHDGLLESVIVEAMNDAEKINGTIIILPEGNQ